MSDFVSLSGSDGIQADEWGQRNEGSGIPLPPFLCLFFVERQAPYCASALSVSEALRQTFETRNLATPQDDASVYRSLRTAGLNQVTRLRLTGGDGLTSVVERWRTAILDSFKYAHAISSANCRTGIFSR